MGGGPSGGGGGGEGGSPDWGGILKASIPFIEWLVGALTTLFQGKPRNLATIQTGDRLAHSKMDLVRALGIHYVNLAMNGIVLSDVNDLKTYFQPANQFIHDFLHLKKGDAALTALDDAIFSGGPIAAFDKAYIDGKYDSPSIPDPTIWPQNHPNLRYPNAFANQLIKIFSETCGTVDTGCAAKLTTCQQALSTAQAQNNADAMTIALLQAQLASVQIQLSNCQAQQGGPPSGGDPCQPYKDQIAQLNGQLQALTTANTGLTAQINQLQAQLAQCQTALAQCQQTLPGPQEPPPPVPPPPGQPDTLEACCAQSAQYLQTVVTQLTTISNQLANQGGGSAANSACCQSVVTAITTVTGALSTLNGLIASLPKTGGSVVDVTPIVNAIAAVNATLKSIPSPVVTVNVSPDDTPDPNVKRIADDIAAADAALPSVRGVLDYFVRAGAVPADLAQVAEQD